MNWVAFDTFFYFLYSIILFGFQVKSAHFVLLPPFPSDIPPCMLQEEETKRKIYCCCHNVCNVENGSIVFQVSVNHVETAVPFSPC